MICVIYIWLALSHGHFTVKRSRKTCGLVSFSYHHQHPYKLDHWKARLISEKLVPKWAQQIEGSKQKMHASKCINRRRSIFTQGWVERVKWKSCNFWSFLFPNCCCNSPISLNVDFSGESFKWNMLLKIWNMKQSSGKHRLGVAHSVYITIAVD